MFGRALLELSEQLQRGHLQLGYLRRHEHERHVQRALHACPDPHSLRSDPPRARAACAAIAPHAPSHLHSPASRPLARIACPPAFDSAGRGGVQPTGGLRHVQRHGHGRHVRGALSVCPLYPQHFSRALLVHAVLAPPPPHTPSRLPNRTSPRIICPFRLCTGHDGLQPAAELRHVQSHRHVRHVLRALRACPVPQPSVRHSQCMCAACAAAPPTPSPASRPESWSVGGSHRMHSFRLGSGRRRLTSR